MAEGDHSLEPVKRVRSPSASHSGHLHKQHINDCESIKSDIIPAILSQLTCEKQDETSPPQCSNELYKVNLHLVSLSTSSINKLTIQELRAILIHHGYSSVGSKEQLVLRVFLLRNNKRSGITAHEEEQVKDLIHVSYNIVLEQRRLALTSYVYRKRLLSTKNIQTKTLSIPIHVSCEQELRSLFKPTVDHLKLIRDTREKEDFTSSYAPHTGHPNLSESVDEQYKAKIKIKWHESEVAGSGWKPGWFTAIVQQYCHAT